MLRQQKSYRAAAFDAVEGGTKPLGEIRPDAAGTWTAHPPSGTGADWVLIIHPAG
jgi:hypothetical protein